MEQERTVCAPERQADMSQPAVTVLPPPEPSQSQPQQQQQQRPQPQPQPHGQDQQLTPSHNPTCTPRLTFWIVSGASWVVWAFATAAAADRSWLDDNAHGEWLAVAEDRVLWFCDNLDDSQEAIYGTICSIYKAFTAMQIIATIVCSVSVALLALACFLPAREGCASVRRFALVAGTLMVIYALFQFLAVVLAGVIKQELNDVADGRDDDNFGFLDGPYSFSESWYEASLGPTFGVGVTGLIFAVIAASLLLVCAKSAGTGPLHVCSSNLILENKKNGNLFGGGGMVAGPDSVRQGNAAANAAGAADVSAPPPYPPTVAASGNAAQAEGAEQTSVPPYDFMPTAQA